MNCTCENLEYSSLLTSFKELLKQNGLKYTKQREVVLKTLYEKNEYNPAFEKFKKAADKNSSEAEYYIGVSYAKGHGVISSNVKICSVP